MSRKHFVMSTLSLAVALSLAGPDTLAMGVGGLRVHSALNQPFVGEIDLLDVKPDELDSVKAQIASAEAFRSAGAERYHYLMKLRFTPQISPRGKTVLRVSSREPIREPYMDFLLEVQWANGRIVKEYTVLLDPPATAGRSRPEIEPPVAQPSYMPAVSSSAPRPAERPVEPPRKIASSPPPDTAPAPIPEGVPTVGFPKYIGPVKSGSGLWRLAVRNAPQGATAAQTAMALYRNNQGAFSNGNINRLSAGKTLVIPSAAELFALNPSEAQREYQAALRGENVRRAPIMPAGPDDRLKIAGAAPSDDKKEIGGSVDAPGPGGMEQELLLVREASESTRQETQEMRGRIRELEAQLSEIQKLLQLRNAELARIQQGTQGSTEGVTVDSAMPQGPDAAVQTGSDGAGKVANGAPLAGAAADGGVSATSPQPAPGAVQSEASAPNGTVAPGVPIVAESEPEAPTAEGPQPLPESTAPIGTVDAAKSPLKAPDSTAALPAVSEARPVGAPATDPKPKPAQVPRAESAPSGQHAGDSTWRALLLPLAGIAGVTALGIGALTWWRSRGRRREEDFTVEIDSLELVDAASAGVSRGAGSELGQPSKGVAVKGSDNMGGVQTPSSAIGTLRRSERETDDTDVISEADIYIAYGRFREAEDLLREEIRSFPRRLDLKLKLADAFFGAKNRPAIEALIQEMKAGVDPIPADVLQRLAEMAESIRSDDDAPDYLSSGFRAAAPAWQTKPTSADQGAAADSLNVVSQEVFSLDISDKQGSVADRLGVDRGRDSTPSASGIKLVDLAPSATGRRQADPLVDGEGLAVGDEELFARHLGLDDDSEDLDIELNALSSGSSAHRSGSDRASADLGRGHVQGVSDLELNIDDLWAASDVDLESFVDAAQIDPKDSEPTSGDIAARTGRGQTTPLRPVPSEASEGKRPSAMTGLFGGQDESGSSDLLTSQWQMDSGLWDETATKLDLARAYIEMGDKESAKGILEEVVGEGNEHQRAEANELLRRVG